MSNNLLRILTGLIGIPIVVGLAYLGGWAFLALVAVMALMAQHEVYHLLKAAGLAPRVTLGLVLGALVLLHQMVPAALAAAIAVLVLAIAFSPFDRATSTNGDTGRPELAVAAGGPQSMAATVFGVIYPTALLGFLAEIRGGGDASVGTASEAGAFAVTSVTDGQAFALTIAVLILVWTTDTLAYFVGRSLGKRPLAPSVSPKKTWEGTIGGALSAIVAGIILKLTLLPFLGWPHVVVVALLCGSLGQLGDLAESKMKRAVGIKDSGALLPGHGGMLDRFDSMIVVAPSVYLYLRYVAGILG